MAKKHTNAQIQPKRYQYSIIDRDMFNLLDFNPEIARLIEKGKGIVSHAEMGRLILRLYGRNVWTDSTRCGPIQTGKDTFAVLMECKAIRRDIVNMHDRRQKY